MRRGDIMGCESGFVGGAEAGEPDRNLAAMGGLDQPLDRVGGRRIDEGHG